AMGQIAEVTQQTNSATQDTTRSVSYLAELAEQLRASVATFRLPEQIAEQAGLTQLAQMENEYQAGLPNLGTPDWGVGMGQLPALPAASAQTLGQSMGLGATEGYTGGYDAGFGAYNEGYNEGYNGGFNGGYSDGYPGAGYQMGAPAGGAFDPMSASNAVPNGSFDFGGYNSPWMNPPQNPQNLPNQLGQIPGYPEQPPYRVDSLNNGNSGVNGSNNPNGAPFPTDHY
ncbi:MAG TPA: methyl-accepting chemotaxis protein, partial [Ktedonobacterales bacterium]|nr:methyl-accepting chemotaxis protein [Ktedonobacterales bacterium]